MYVSVGLLGLIVALVSVRLRLQYALYLLKLLKTVSHPQELVVYGMLVKNFIVAQQYHLAANWQTEQDQFRH